MHFYRTLPTPEGQQLADQLATIRREGIDCEAQAAAFAASVGAESYVPAVGSDYGGISAFVFSHDQIHKQLLEGNSIFKPLTSDNGDFYRADNGTPYFEPNYTLTEEAMRYDRAQRQSKRPDVIVSPGKLKLAAVVNMMSRTQIIKEATGKKPRYSNEFQILNGNRKFLYNRAKQHASEMGREHLNTWLDTYSKLQTKADWKNMFPHGLTSGEYDQLAKSRSELSAAINAIKDKDWSIVVTIQPGEDVKTPEARSRIYGIAHSIYNLPVIAFGTTHAILGAALPSSGQPARPATRRIDTTEYICIREEATAKGLEEITSEEYSKAFQVVDQTSQDK